MPAYFAPHDAASGEAAYQGRLTASMTHEFKNVLAIIGETAGLMADLLEAAPDMPQNERFDKLLEKIEAQVERGQKLATWLNRFAHLPDARPCTVDPAKLTVQVTALAVRLARLAEVSLDLGQCLEDRLECDPVALHQALFAAMEHEWKLLPAKSTLHIFCRPEASGYTWRLRGESSSGEVKDASLEMDAATQATLARAGLTAHRKDGELVLVVPDGATRGEE